MSYLLQQMLSDRSYMREYSRREMAVLMWILGLTVGGFVLQSAFDSWAGLRSLFPFTQYFALSTAGLRHGFVWQLVTYTMLHSSILHLLFNGLGLYFLGRELITLLGSRRFVGLYVGAAILGGLCWFAVHFERGGMVVGCSSALSALLVVFACFYPNREITFLLFLIIPVTLKPKYIAYIFAGIALCGFLFGELPGTGFEQGVAHSAHLGGMLAGLLYYRFLHHSDAWALAPRTAIELPRWMKRAPKNVSPASYKVNLTNRGDLRAEVDRILDKINSSGFGALTPEEKRVLDEARDLMSRR